MVLDLMFNAGAGGSGLGAADQSEVEAASSNVVAVTPGRAKYHPGVSKGWINFNGTGTIATVVSYNVSGIVDLGTGSYTVTWDTDFSGNNYCTVVGTNATNFTDAGTALVTAQVAGSCTVTTQLQSSGATDFSAIYVAAFGDQ